MMIVVGGSSAAKLPAQNLRALEPRGVADWRTANSQGERGITGMRATTISYRHAAGAAIAISSVHSEKLLPSPACCFCTHALARHATINKT